MSTFPLLDLPANVYRYQEGGQDVFTFRWHGLAYLASFALALWLLRRFSARGQLALQRRELPEFVIFGALLGVLAGGRLGYAFLYDWPHVSGDLSLLLKMNVNQASFFGGLLGLIVFTAFQARKHHVSFLNLTDHLAVVAPLGMLLGRLADFMTGEAFGRTTSVPWALRFPLEVHLPAFTPALPTEMAAEELPAHHGAIMDLAHINPDLMNELVRILNPRHPWALYAALLEGAVLFCVLFALRQRMRSLAEGVLSGVFLLGYGVLRLGVDFFREPSLGDPLQLGLTLEQWLCIPLLLAGVGLLGLSRAASRVYTPVTVS
ncbi:prolipoprotein diacylglyceryl transferase [Hyalangium minutum]|uniref:Prolipoprotein diacylglyceryl transferase n=1 Tax=Hyalangium minutum TaxID=394096 RepID=A0A085W4K1_9BACT|nr:prolipoprotein diacylglyceryl transferase [Hyalangium minutum]KFE62614.1 Prolipoprotein diacylglyceryl transferase [Hyalangium minutum]